MPYKDPEAKRANNRRYYVGAAKEKKRAREAAWRKANREKILAWNKANHAANRDKRNAQSAIWYKANKERARETRAAWRKANQGYGKISVAARKSRISGRPKPDFCEACGRPPSDKGIVFDHCHKKGHFRGWICQSCNLTLGLVHDDVQILLKLVAYLKRSQNGAVAQLAIPGL